MKGQSIRNNLKGDKSSRKRPAAVRPVRPMPSWLPAKTDGFAAWGKAAERARVDFFTLWSNHCRNMGDDKLGAETDAAREIWLDAISRAYPPGFWENLDDMLAGKVTNLEPYLQFLEVDAYFFGSGYAKSRALLGLKRIELTVPHQSRLQNVILHVIDKGWCREFRDYCRLARVVQTSEWLFEVEQRLQLNDGDRAVRARWVLEACRRK